VTGFIRLSDTAVIRAAIELAALFYEGDGKKTYPQKARTVLLEHLRNHPDDILAKRFGEEIRLKEAAESNKSTPNDWFFYADFLHDCLASFISRLTLFAITDLIKQEKPNLIHG
jgi:hypothetical protein